VIRFRVLRKGFIGLSLVLGQISNIGNDVAWSANCLYHLGVGPRGDLWVLR